MVVGEITYVWTLGSRDENLRHILRQGSHGGIQYAPAGVFLLFCADTLHMSWEVLQWQCVQCHMHHPFAVLTAAAHGFHWIQQVQRKDPLRVEKQDF